MKYPEDINVDWADFANRAKSILLQHGKTDGHHHVAYEDEFITVTYDRSYGGHHKGGFLEVTRKKMPGHEGDHLHRTTNPVFMESDFKIIRIHGEGRYIYQHLIDLTTPKEKKT